MTHFSDLEFTSWSVQPPSTSTRGARLALVTDSGGRPPTFKLTTLPTLSSPWGATSFDGTSSRMSINYHLEPDHVTFFDRLDEWFVRHLSTHSERLFKKTYTQDEMRSLYRPLVTRHEGYQPTLRTKLNSEGPRRVRLWSAKCTPLEGDELANLRQYLLAPVLAIKGVWNMSKEIGVTIETQHIMLSSASTDDCPSGED